MSTGTRGHGPAERLRHLVPGYLLDSLHAVRGARNVCQQPSRDGDFYSDLRNLGHRLHGSGATYGFPNITTQARSLRHAAAVADGGACYQALHRLERTLCHELDHCEDELTQKLSPPAPGTNAGLCSGLRAAEGEKHALA